MLDWRGTPNNYEITETLSKFGVLANLLPDISFLHKGEINWQGHRNEVMRTNSVELNNFVYASEFMKKLKQSLTHYGD
jgi:hypothetical protein